MTKPTPPSIPAKRTEVDPAKLDAEDAKTRCASIYKLEKAVEAKAAAHTIAKAKAKTAKDNLDHAEEALRKEITEQRFGPGPLFPVEGAK